MLGTTILLAASIALGQADQVSPNYEHLKGLEQFVGEWHATMSQKDVVLYKGTASYKWAKNKSFMLATYLDENGELFGTEVFGWDAAAGKMRLWTFKPDGSRNEAVISVKGDVFSGDYDMIELDGTVKKSVVKGKFDGKEFKVTVRFEGATDDAFTGTYRRK